MSALAALLLAGASCSRLSLGGTKDEPGPGDAPGSVTGALAQPRPDAGAAPSSPGDSACTLITDAMLQAVAPGFPSLPATFSADIPHDAYDSTQYNSINRAKVHGCRAEQLQVQRLYDLFSWRSFLALNWPVIVATDGTVQPQARFVSNAQSTPGKAMPQWATWKELNDVFKSDGASPGAWSASRNVPEEMPGASPPAPGSRQRLLFDTVPKSNDPLLTNMTQAFAHPLWDQNGKPVYYEALVNKDEYDFIVEHQLYNLEGQARFLGPENAQNAVNFGPGTLTRGGVLGPMEVKLAWKVLGGNDLPERFFRMDAQVLTEAGTYEAVAVGLVGMHIAHKTLSSGRWVWSTFEHVDNVRVKESAVLARTDSQQQPLKPSFFDPSCPTCPVNENPAPDASGVKRTQVTRVIPISEPTADLNQQVQQMLRGMKSEWQYYELVGTQYAANNVSLPVPCGQGADSITNHSGGRPTPAYLANAVLETYFQEGNHCSSLVNADAGTLVFETSSCMGCHSDAGLVRTSGQGTATVQTGTGDFSWVFTRARSTSGQQPRITIPRTTCGAASPSSASCSLQAPSPTPAAP